MKNILILLFALSSFLSYAQTNKEVKFEQIDGKYHLKIVTTIDGEKKVYDKTYDTLEEMKRDTELEGKLHVFDKDSNAIFFSDDDEGDKNINVFIKEGDSKYDIESLREFQFDSIDDSASIHQIKVWVDGQ